MTEKQDPDRSTELATDLWLVNELLRIDITEAGDDVTLTLAGELDTSSAHQLRKCLMDKIQLDRRVLVDTTSLSFCGSAGLAAFIEAHDLARDRRARLRIVVPPAAHLHRVLEIAGVVERLNVVPDLAAGYR